ncbi:hypothetical protein [Mesorhizobium sp.]|uniref:hypothetical protein n=1 Tax=Mesorhizobium sp. TaxID=1871066 RepID=UPI000FEA983B|nr:hypothetical protein [Mesorhizobium sp.]RWO77593.1 MAG: hypothetical protein EOQ96_31630 [Mesorhizobium sp.]RWP03275.1 MAG: hypothetical protein EOQ97_25025 [Mesorhizobium sp.]RWQ18802.1 MAG: hypothetical protein EOR93_18115 [Mesorhizobium sp.]TIU40103.1 MAG: hypothetical protein E5W26_11395 [Mesorhizobium sp.]
MSLALDILKKKKLELLAQAADIRKGIREIDAALDVLGDPDAAKATAVSSGAGPSPINNAIIDAISQGNTTPATIFDFITEHRQIDTSKASVSTRLSKMKHEGLIDNDGQGWALVGKAEGSGAETPEPSNTELGPVGRERGYPPSAPEGSIPSGSTVVQNLQAGVANVQATMPARSRELDDEIPF